MRIHYILPELIPELKKANSIIEKYESNKLLLLNPINKEVYNNSKINKAILQNALDKMIELYPELKDMSANEQQDYLTQIYSNTLLSKEDLPKGFVNYHYLEPEEDAQKNNQNTDRMDIDEPEV